MLGSFRLLTLRSAGGALLLVSLVVCSPSRVSAECGNYVTILNRQPIAGQEMPAVPLAHHVPKSPCRGPNCSNLPVEPFTPLPVPVHPTAEVKALIVDFGNRPDAGCGFMREPFS